MEPKVEPKAGRPAVAPICARTYAAPIKGLVGKERVEDVVTAQRVARSWTLPERLASLAASRLLVVSIIAVGLVLRVVRWAHDRSLWGDEGALALNILEKSYGDLLRPLSFTQGAPTGFLLLEKAAFDVFGDGELALRLVSLLAGIASLFVFAALARRLLQPVTAAFALALFATLEPLVYYSSEVKQYSSDVLVTLLLVYAAVVVDWARIRPRDGVMLAVAGAALAWCSHPGLIAIGALTLVLLVTARHAGETVRFRKLALLAGAWLGSALGALVVNGHNARKVGAAALGTVDSSHESPLGVVKDVWDAYDSAYGFARTTVALAVALTAAGFVSLLRRRPTAALLLAAPMVATFFAAAVHRYPYADRFALFMTPLVILLVAEGVEAVYHATRRRAPVFMALCVFLLLAYPAGGAARKLLSPPGHEEVKSVLQRLSSGWRPGDSLFVWYQSQYPFRYYAECNDCDGLSRQVVSDTLWPRHVDEAPDPSALVSHPPQLYVGKVSHDPDAYLVPFDALRGKKRVWLLFSSTWDDAFVRLVLDCTGHRLLEARATRAVLYLYDLSASRSSVAACGALARTPVER